MPPETQGDTVDSRERAAAGPPLDDNLHFLVLEGNGSAFHLLPRTGSLLIARNPDAGIVIRDPSVSRLHAEVVLDNGEARIVDLGSHNGVRVNGEKVSGSQALQSGDVVMLGDVTLVFHAGARPRPPRLVLDPMDLRARLTEELERVVSYERSVSVLALYPGQGAVPTQALLTAVGIALRMIDHLGQSGTTLEVVLPELGAEEARAVGEQLIEILQSLAPQVRVGVSTAPQDGLNAEALFTAARTAALAAPAGGLLANSPAARRITVGDRSVVIADPAMVKVYELVRTLAATDLPVLIHGETGSGKGSAAWAVHHWSKRSGQPFVALNCAALVENRADAELSTRLEQARGGTLFLVEVGELSLSIQAKLMQALDQVRPAGPGEPQQERAADPRVVATTSRALGYEVKAGLFRDDLYQRLSTGLVVLPPLRHRPCDLPLLVNELLADACARQHRAPLHVSAAAMSELTGHNWPDNVRELRNAMEHAVSAVASGSIVEPSHLPIRGPPPPDLPAQAMDPELTEPSTLPGAGGEPTTEPGGFRSLAEELRQLERKRMCEALSASGGLHSRAAKLVGMPLRTFTLKLKRYQIAPKDWETPP